MIISHSFWLQEPSYWYKSLNKTTFSCGRPTPKELPLEWGKNKPISRTVKRRKYMSVNVSEPNLMESLNPVCNEKTITSTEWRLSRTDGPVCTGAVTNQQTLQFIQIPAPEFRMKHTLEKSMNMTPFWLTYQI